MDQHRKGLGYRVMTEYTDIVEKARTTMEAEKWAKGAAYLHLNNGVIETKFNNGDIHYQETKDKGKSWTVSSNLSQDDLVAKFLKLFKH